MGFPPDVKTEAIVAAQRSCCVCHKFCAVNIECHHIIPEASGGANNFDNCIPLCFDCHADAEHYNPKHPKGNKYSSEELRMHRDGWYARVAASPATVTEQGSLEVDRAVFSKIRAILTDEGSMEFMRVHDFGGSFERSELDELKEFRRWSRLPASEFLNADLEILRSNLSEAIQDFLNNMAANTWPLERPNGGFSKISGEDERGGKLFYERRELLNTGSDAVYEAYSALIRTCRRRLAIN